jgi:hypothetical protein
VASSPLDQIRSLLPKLNGVERKKIAMLVAKYPGGATNGSVRSDNPELDWLLQGFISELKRRGHPVHLGSMTAVRQLAPNYEVASHEIRGYLERQLDRSDGRPASRTELVVLGGILGRSLAVHIEPRMPVALRPMLLNVDSTLEALENSFPGYLAAGMIPMLTGRR